MARFDKLEFNTPQKPDVDPEEIKRDDLDENYWINKATDNRRAGLYENALKYYSRALEKNRLLVEGWVGQIQMLVFLDELPEAELWGRKALELFPSNGELLSGRAQAFCRIGNIEQAYENCDGAFQQTGQSAYRWIVRGEIMTCTRQEKESYCFDKAQEADHDWLVPLEIAIIYLYYRNANKALQRARQAVQLSSESPYCWYIQGCCQLQLGIDGKARESFHHCLDLSPRHVGAGQKLIELDRNRWSPFHLFRRLFRLF